MRSGRIDAEFYRKVNQQLHAKDRQIRALQQRVEELQARAALEAGVVLDPEEPVSLHPEHDEAIALAAAAGETRLDQDTPAARPPAPKLARRLAALRELLEDPDATDEEVGIVGLRLLEWYLRRKSEGKRVQLVDESGTPVEVDLIL